MSDDRLRVLEMIQNKAITAAEGAELLKALDGADENLKPVPQKNAFKMFKIKVISADGDKVNVQIPVEFARVALKSGKGYMKLDQIEDLDLDIDAILEMIDKGMLGEIVNVESADGDLVKIVIE
jgi:hypothetical protein